MTETLTTTNEICEKYRISKAMVHKLRQSGLPYITIGRCIRYSMGEVEAWIADIQDEQDGYDPVREHEREAMIEDMNGASHTKTRKECEV